jgi:hypothetical protein
VQGWHNESTSQTYLLKLETTQSDACTINVTITDQSFTGEHKFKVGGGPGGGWCGARRWSGRPRHCGPCGWAGGRAG